MKNVTVSRLSVHEGLTRLTSGSHPSYQIGACKSEMRVRIMNYMILMCNNSFLFQYPNPFIPIIVINLPLDRIFN